MDRVIYTTLSGANAALHRQQVLSNNLANISSNGFRAELSTFRSVPLRGEGASTRAFALDATAGHLDSPGTMNSTGRNLDVAAVGRAYFAIQALDGTEAYTRAGSLQVSAQGQLVGHAGLPMLDEGGAPINVPNNAHLMIAQDGSVSARVGNEPPQALGRLKLVTPDDDAQRLVRGNDGLFRSLTGDPLPADPVATLKDGVLEGSNVNAIEAMVGMISAARQYELQMRMLQNTERNDQTASRLLGLTG